MITAGYDSRCPSCDEMVFEGEQIGEVDEQWVCEDCVDDNGGEDE